MSNLENNVYESAEDTFLLLEVLKKRLKLESKKKKLRVCEVGVGSGEILSQIERIYPQNKYYGTDININAINLSKKRTKNSIIKKGNLLEVFNFKFDLIFFNTPYLPCEDEECYENLNLKDKAIYGGKFAYEVIYEFIFQLNDKLNECGEAYILFSSLSNQKYIEIVLSELSFKFKIVSKQKLFFEELIVLKITKDEILKKISSKGVQKIKYLDSGKHSKVLEGEFQSKKVIIKIGKEQYLSKEAFFMKKLKGEEFIPSFNFEGKNFVVREKLEGLQIKYWIEKANKKELIKIISKVFDFCFRLDELGINKFEMTNPYKHIFIDENLNCKMIDFERCTFTEDPKNTTQFLQYVKKNVPIFKKKKLVFSNKKILEIGKKYKKDKKRFYISKII